MLIIKWLAPSLLEGNAMNYLDLLTSRIFLSIDIKTNGILPFAQIKSNRQDATNEGSTKEYYPIEFLLT